VTKAAHLRRLIEEGRGPVLTAGAHDGLGAVLAERAGYRAIWASGLEISAAHAVPDVGLLGISDYLAAARIMNQACALPVIADCRELKVSRPQIPRPSRPLCLRPCPHLCHLSRRPAANAGAVG